MADNSVETKQKTDNINKMNDAADRDRSHVSRNANAFVADIERAIEAEGENFDMKPFVERYRHLEEIYGTQDMPLFIRAIKDVSPRLAFEIRIEDAKTMLDDFDKKLNPETDEDDDDWFSDDGDEDSGKASSDGEEDNDWSVDEDEPVGKAETEPENMNGTETEAEKEEEPESEEAETKQEAAEKKETAPVISEEEIGRFAEIFDDIMFKGMRKNASEEGPETALGISDVIGAQRQHDLCGMAVQKLGKPFWSRYSNWPASFSTTLYDDALNKIQRLLNDENEEELLNYAVDVFELQAYHTERGASQADLEVLYNSIPDDETKEKFLDKLRTSTPQMAMCLSVRKMEALLEDQISGNAEDRDPEERQQAIDSFIKEYQKTESLPKNDTDSPAIIHDLLTEKEMQGSMELLAVKANGAIGRQFWQSIDNISDDLFKAKLVDIHSVRYESKNNEEPKAEDLAESFIDVFGMLQKRQANESQPELPKEIYEDILERYAEASFAFGEDFTGAVNSAVTFGDALSEDILNQKIARLNKVTKEAVPEMDDMEIREEDADVIVGVYEGVLKEIAQRGTIKPAYANEIINTLENVTALGKNHSVFEERIAKVKKDNPDAIKVLVGSTPDRAWVTDSRKIPENEISELVDNFNRMARIADPSVPNIGEKLGAHFDNLYLMLKKRNNDFSQIPVSDGINQKIADAYLSASKIFGSEFRREIDLSDVRSVQWKIISNGVNNVRNSLDKFDPSNEAEKEQNVKAFVREYVSSLKALSGTTGLVDDMFNIADVFAKAKEKDPTLAKALEDAIYADPAAEGTLALCASTATYNPGKYRTNKDLTSKEASDFLGIFKIVLDERDRGKIKEKDFDNAVFGYYGTVVKGDSKFRSSVEKLVDKYTAKNDQKTVDILKLGLRIMPLVDEDEIEVDTETFGTAFRTYMESRNEDLSPEIPDAAEIEKRKADPNNTDLMFNGMTPDEVGFLNQFKQDMRDARAALRRGPSGSDPLSMLEWCREIAILNPDKLQERLKRTGLDADFLTADDKIKQEYAETWTHVYDKFSDNLDSLLTRGSGNLRSKDIVKDGESIGQAIEKLDSAFRKALPETLYSEPFRRNWFNYTAKTTCVVNDYRLDEMMKPEVLRENLRVLQDDLSATDPFWKFGNSKQFRNLKTAVESAMKSLKNYDSKNETPEMKADLLEKMDKLAECAKIYSDKKDKELEKSNPYGIRDPSGMTRDERRAETAAKILGLAGSVVTNTKMLKAAEAVVAFDGDAQKAVDLMVDAVEASIKYPTPTATRRGLSMTYTAVAAKVREQGGKIPEMIRKALPGESDPNRVNRITEEFKTLQNAQTNTKNAQHTTGKTQPAGANHQMGTADKNKGVGRT